MWQSLAEYLNPQCIRLTVPPPQFSPYFACPQMTGVVVSVAPSRKEGDYLTPVIPPPQLRFACCALSKGTSSRSITAWAQFRILLLQTGV